MAMPKVSVIIPVYNSAPWLRRCLDTVCGQTLRDIEIIVIDDSSEDESVNIINEYIEEDSRILFIRNDNNKGVSYCRNTGINKSSGEYIAFIDSDDFIDSDFFEVLYSNNNCEDIIKGNILMYNETLNKNYCEDWNDLNYDMKQNKSYFCCAFTSAIFNKRFITKNSICFPEKRKYFEDPRFSIIASIKAKKVKIIDSTYYYYRHFHKKNININQDINNVVEKIDEINSLLRYINRRKIIKDDYIVYASFLYRHINSIPQSIPESIIKNISCGLASFYKKCKFLEEVIELSFTYQTRRAMRRHAQAIRNILLDKNSR